MPICPGCERVVPHDRLADHQRNCADIWSDTWAGGSSVEHLEQRLRTVERTLGARFERLEREYEDRLSRLEQGRRVR